MGSFSIWHWLVLAIYIAIFLVPAWRIVGRAGFHPAWSLLGLIPVVNLIAYWVFAFVSWPVRAGR